MGKGEWCVWGSCAQLPKESNEESNDALGQRELGLAATVAQKIQGPGSSGRRWRRGRAHVGRARHSTPRWTPSEAGRTNPTHTIPLSPFPFPHQEKESRSVFVT